MANKVPDTNNFSLQNVCDVVKQGVNTLDSCFEKANDNYFDSRYKGNKNSLYNFRNYGGEVVNEPTKILWTRGGYLSEHVNYLNNNTKSAYYTECKSSGSHRFYMGHNGNSRYKGYVEFDTSQITSCTDAEIWFYTGDDWWNRNWKKEIVECTFDKIEENIPTHHNQKISPEWIATYNPINLIESGYISSSIDRPGCNIKLTSRGVNLINTYPKLKLLIQISDDNWDPASGIENYVRFTMGYMKPPTLFIT